LLTFIFLLRIFYFLNLTRAGIVPAIVSPDGTGLNWVLLGEALYLTFFLLLVIFFFQVRPLKPGDEERGRREGKWKEDQGRIKEGGRWKEEEVRRVKE
jgi:hypothetical protein